MSTCYSFINVAENIAKMDDAQLNTEYTKTTCISLTDLFMYQVQSLMDILQVLGVSETPRLINLLSQLDFNGFYLSIAPKTEYMSHPLVPPVESRS